MEQIGKRVLMAAALAGSLVPSSAEAQLGHPVDEGDEITASARLQDASGSELGRVLLRQTPGQGVILEIRVTGLEPGTHAVHIHETGSCRAPDFGSAGGHYAPEGRAHGALHADGMHGGDLLNLHVPASGEVRAERLAPHVTLRPDAPGTLFDDDGSAIIVHAGADDYRSQPSGDAGGRVLCGVVRR